MSFVGSNILAGASGQGGAAGYEIERSLRFNAADTAHLEQTFTSVGNQRVMTFSFWVKKNNTSSSGELAIAAMDYDTSGAAVTARSLSMYFGANTLKLYDYGASDGPGDTGSSVPWYPGSVENGRLFRDPSAWYHVVFAIDTTQSTAANRCKVWINGEQGTHSSQPTQNTYLSWGQVRKHYIGIQKVNGSFTRKSELQLAEFQFIDGQQLAATDFGETDDNGVWQPKKFSGTYGPLVNQSQTWSSDWTGDFYSGYGPTLAFNNDFGHGVAVAYPSNGATGRTVTISPAISGSVIRVNYARSNTSTPASINGTETLPSTGAGSTYQWHTLTATSISSVTLSHDPIGSSYITAIEVDGKLLVDSGVTVTDNSFYLPFSDNSASAQLGLDYSQGVPGTNNKGMEVVTYTGTGSTRSIEGLSFAPDLVWIKGRSTGSNTIQHVLQDTVRGTNSLLTSNENYREADLGTHWGYISSFNSDGFTLTPGAGGTDHNNYNNLPYVAWCWKAGDTTSSNTDGTITSSVSANDAYGFSIATFVGTGSNASFGHGLSTSPKFVIVKDRTSSYGWTVWHAALTGGEYIVLNSGSAKGTSAAVWNSTVPSSSVISVGTDVGTNKVSDNYVCYSWSEVAGFSKFGSYSGGTNPKTVTTGFKPRFLIFKRTDSANHWILIDSARGGTQKLAADLSVAENDNATIGDASQNIVEFLADGFKLTTTNAATNVSGGTYIYAAFAANPANDWTVNNLTATSTKAATFNGTTNVSGSMTALGNQDWTVELFFEKTGSGTQEAFFGFPSNSPYFEYDGGKLRWMLGNTYGPTLVQNQRYHAAWVRHNNKGYIYLNGTLISPSSGITYTTNETDTAFAIGARQGGGTGLNGYMDNLRVVIGTALYTSNFAVPSTPLTAVANCKLLALQTDLTTDSSGQNVTLTNNGAVFSDPNGPSVDSLLDSPSQLTTQTDSGVGGEITGNYATLNPLAKASSLTLSNGNLDASGSAIQGCATSTIFAPSGKYYCEFTLNSAQNDTAVGVVSTDVNASEDWVGEQPYTVGYLVDGRVFQSGSATSYSSYTVGDVIGVAFDVDTGKVWFAKNNTWLNSGNPSAGTNQVKTISGGKPLGFAFRGVGGAGSFNFGQRAFVFSAPTNFKALNTASLPTPTIADGSKYFDTKLYTGNGSTQSVTGYNFSPDFVWLKSRNQTYNHYLLDQIRGAGKVLHSNNSDVTQNQSDTLTSFNSDGFSLDSRTGVNSNNNTFVGWSWDAGSYNTTIAAGSISSGVPSRASTVRSSPESGFSIVSFTANGTAGTTIAHGLNAVPEFIVVKDREYAQNWQAYHGSLGGTKMFNWNTDESVYTDAGGFNNTNPNSNVFTLGNYSGYFGTNEMIAYCFAPVEGYSKFGSYTGNGSSDGPFIYTGFRPAWIMTKEITQAYPWQIQDTTRAPKNDAKEILYSDKNWAEANSNANMDILSNGFKPRRGSGYFNLNGGTIIYLAFAENPFKTARAR